MHCLLVCSFYGRKKFLSYFRRLISIIGILICLNCSNGCTMRLAMHVPAEEKIFRFYNELINIIFSPKQMVNVYQGEKYGILKSWNPMGSPRESYGILGIRIPYFSPWRIRIVMKFDDLIKSSPSTIFSQNFEWSLDKCSV